MASKFSEADQVSIAQSIEDILSAKTYMGTELAGIWSVTADACWNFEKRKEIFLYIINFLLERRLITFGRNAKILEKSNQELITDLRLNWPAEDDFDDDLFFVTHDRATNQYRCWTVGDLVWIEENGNLNWSTEAEH